MSFTEAASLAAQRLISANDYRMNVATALGEKVGSSWWVSGNVDNSTKFVVAVDCKESVRYFSLYVELSVGAAELTGIVDIHGEGEHPKTRTFTWRDVVIQSMGAQERNHVVDSMIDYGVQLCRAGYGESEVEH